MSKRPNQLHASGRNDGVSKLCWITSTHKRLTKERPGLPQAVDKSEL